MDKGASFLFAGISFNRKKFSSDFARFQEKKEGEKSIEEPVIVEDETVEEEENEVENKKRVSAKKRKRKAASSEDVEGIRVFKSSKSGEPEPEEEEDKQPKDLSALEKKKLNRQHERDLLFRKAHGIHVSGSNIPSPLQDFAELSSRFGCNAKLLRNLEEIGFEEPTAIQRQAMPLLLSGRECFACAPTGSGKTLAFVCPILMKLKRPSKDAIRAVILCPSRELATQTLRECKKFAEGSTFGIKLMSKQLIRSGDLSKFTCDILISTPLRLKFAIRKKKLKLSKVEYLVLDESDKLFELGLVKQIDAIVKACSNPSIVRALFSATLPDSVEQLARTIMHDAVRIVIGRKNAASENVKQKLVFAGSEEGKLLALRQSFAERLNPPVLIFVQSKERAKELYSELVADNIRVDVIHSDLSQSERDDAVDNFRAGKTWVLIATDVIARGMDFKGINCVINYDFPDSTSAYIHRIGRSGRAGRSGEAITLYTEDDIPFLRNIAKAMKSSGSEFPPWALALNQKKWRKHRPRRESISTTPNQ